LYRSRKFFIILVDTSLWFDPAAPGNVHLFLGISFKHCLNAIDNVKDAGTTQFVIDAGAALFILNQAGIFQHAQVLRYGRDIGPDHFSEFIYASFLSVQFFKNEEPRGMAHGFEYARARFILGLKFLFHEHTPPNSIRSILNQWCRHNRRTARRRLSYP
jgi:hypothetical protein